MQLIEAARMSAIKPSPSILAKQKVTELRAAGRDIIDFSIGEPFEPTPPHIVQAALDAMNGGDTHYTSTTGTPALRRAVRSKLERENRLLYADDQILVGIGAKQLIFEAFAATLNADDEVIIPAPYWVSYPDMVTLNGAAPIIVPCPEAVGFKLTAAALEAAITPRTRWLVLNSPNNPSGAVYSRREMEELAGVLVRYPHVWVLTDEIYEHLIYGGGAHINPVQIEPALAERTLIINGVSKAYAMTGWRIGYAAGPKPLISLMTTLVGQSTTCPSSISQAAAVAALTGDQACVRIATSSYEQRRDQMLAKLEGIPGIRCTVPNGAFYLFPSVAGLIGKRTPTGRVLQTDLDVSLYFLEAAGVAVLDGTAYGMPSHLRFSFATSIEAIEMGCERLHMACAELRVL